MAERSYDTILKHLVEAGPRDWPALLGRPDAPAEVIDADLATVSRSADKVLRVGGEEPYLMHLEFHAGKDGAQLPAKLNARAALLEQRHDLPVLTAVVVLSAEADSPRLDGRYVRALSGRVYRVFEYEVVRVWQVPPERLLARLSTLPLAPISAVTEAEVPGIIEQMAARLGRRDARARAGDLWTAAYILMGARYSRDEVRALLRGVRHMSESPTWRAIFEEGAEKGVAAGVLTGLRRAILLVGEPRWGAASSRVRKRLERITDSGRLEKMLARIETAPDWSALLTDEPSLGQPQVRRRTRG